MITERDMDLIKQRARKRLRDTRARVRMNYLGRRAELLNGETDTGRGGIGGSEAPIGGAAQEVPSEGAGGDVPASY